jgi:hypothetical protein
VQLAILLLLVVALGFLVLGLVAGSTPLVTTSVVTSVVAILLVPEPVSPAVEAPLVAEEQDDDGDETGTDPDFDPVPRDEPGIATSQAPLAGHADDLVFVIDGRPRYHVTTCGFIVGRGSEPVTLRQAVEDGFTPCALCDPDTALSTMPSSAPG